RRFLRESNAIEGIHREPTEAEIEGLRTFLELDVVTVADLERLVAVFAPGHRLRDKPGLNVRVGNYVAPPGGPAIRERLDEILDQSRAINVSAWEVHVAYEALHPFTDGNGRSGRALWLRQMGGFDSLGFLHRFYYQTLENVGK